MTELRPFNWGYTGASGSHEYVQPAVMKLVDPPPARVLDVGCGNGFLSGELARRGYDVVGVDPSETGIRLAREAYPQLRFEPIAADSDVLKRLDSDAFDVVVSTEVVEHLYAPDAWAVGCFSALKPGGLLVCSTPYHGYLKNLVLAATGRLEGHLMPLHVGGHIKFFSRAQLEQLLKDAGFQPAGFLGTGRVPYLWKSMVLAARKPMSGNVSPERAQAERLSAHR